MLAAPLDPTAQASGLSDTVARQRLAADGYNELPHPPRRTRWRITGEIIREPMFGLLVAAGSIYFALGDPLEGFILALFATASISIAVVQESRTERVLEALRDLTSPRALVVRDGRPQRIAGRDVVRGDVILLAEGDRVPADATLTASHDIQADESMITGESVPVRKTATAEPAGGTVRPGGEDTPYVFAGTMIVRGQGTAVVHATGAHTEIGKIGLALGTIETEPARLTEETKWLVRSIAMAALCVSALVVVLYGWSRDDWLNGLLGGIAVSMSLMPEEFPLVLTVFMAMGAWRISRIRVLTRRATAIETLGAATVLCTDKTGTLTQNRMSIAELRPGTSGAAAMSIGDAPLAGGAATLIEYGILASEIDGVDPMDRAFLALADRLQARDAPAADSKLIHEYGLGPSLLAVTHVWRVRGRDGSVVATKGAPEDIARLSGLGPAEIAGLRRTIDDMASRGLRVLGVARARYDGATWPDTPHGFAFQFLGLVGLSDPLRPGVTEAVAECRSAGIGVVMITGDYPATARAIASAAGIAGGDVIAGNDLLAMNDGELTARVGTASVFARVVPEQKLRIVNALKKRGQIVAMTGDGVNDAPSLKAAHIGIAMGGRGTDVAREAASIVLLDDDFTSIVKTIRLGRRIYDNLRKAMGYILAVHVPIAGLSLLPFAFGWPLLFGPIHVAVLEMIIDPACSVVFEAEGDERDVMHRPPRDPAGRIFSLPLVGWSLLQGALALLMVGGVCIWAASRGVPADEVRALSFVGLVLANVALILVNRSFSASPLRALLRPNATIWWAFGAVAALLGAVLSWPAARGLFQFGPLRPGELPLLIVGAVLLAIVLEFLKPLWRARLQS
jgi:P-type Ca2+ transporter type 2C